MNVYAVIQSQYLSALEMMKCVIENCPEALWTADTHKNRTWHIAFHALFYVHLYLQPGEADFVPFRTSDSQRRSLAEIPGDAAPYSRTELLEYLAFCREQVRTVVPRLDLHGPSGFDWLPFSKLETQFYNIRHLMQHTGELMERLWRDAGVEVGWVGMQPVQGSQD